MSELPGRITGTEMEWGVVVPGAENKTRGRQLLESEILPFVREYLYDVPYIGDTSNASVFLGNGSRLYPDVGNHREYATQEDDSYLGTTANEIVGENIMYDIMQRASEKYPVYGLHKQVADEDGNTWGYHENYGVDATKLQVNTKQLALHGVHLATRNIFFGGGMLMSDGSFVISQKVAGIVEDFNNSPTRTKALVNLRNRTYADDKRFGRVHVTSADPNMSPWATRMKLGTTSLVLRMIENGEQLEHIRAKGSLLAVAEEVSRDLSLTQKFTLKSGAVMTALDIQEYLCNAVKQRSDSLVRNWEDAWTIEEWERACADARQNPALLENRTDWMIRKKILDRYQQTTGYDWDSAEMRMKDRDFCRISPFSSGIQLRDRLWSEWMPDPALIKSRHFDAPTTTRAQVRGDFIKTFGSLQGKQKQHNARVFWANVQLGYEAEIKLTDPYAAAHPEVTRMIESATI